MNKYHKGRNIADYDRRRKDDGIDGAEGAGPPGGIVARNFSEGKDTGLLVCKVQPSVKIRSFAKFSRSFRHHLQTENGGN